MYADEKTRDFVRDTIRRAMSAPILSIEREQELTKAWCDDGDEDALSELTESHMRMAVSTAIKFRGYGLPLGDLIQEGAIGLLEAAKRFDYRREVRFSTYAGWWIRASMQDYVLRNWSIVRTGTTAAQKSLFFNLRRLRALIKDTSSGQLTPENRAYVAQALRVGEDDVEKMASRLAAVDRSLNAPFSEDGEGEWQDLLADENPDPETQVMEDRDQAQRAQWLGEAMARLSAREQLIIRERRLGEDSVTLEKLGERLGISKERVRQVEHQALKKLKQYLTEVVGDPEEAGLLPTG